MQTYHKLVRDRIPEIIEIDGKKCGIPEIIEIDGKKCDCETLWAC